MIAAGYSDAFTSDLRWALVVLAGLLAIVVIAVIIGRNFRRQRRNWWSDEPKVSADDPDSRYRP